MTPIAAAIVFGGGNGGGTTSIDLFHECTASEIDSEGYPIYEEIIKTVSESKMDKMLFLTPNGTNKWVVWIYRNSFFDPINSAEVVLDKLVNVSVEQTFTDEEKVQGLANLGLTTKSYELTMDDDSTETVTVAVKV